MNLLDYLYFGKIDLITEKMRKKIKKSLTVDTVQSAAREIFNKKTNMYVAVLGNITEEFVPSFDYFKDNFLVWEDNDEQKKGNGDIW